MGGGTNSKRTKRRVVGVGRKKTQKNRGDGVGVGVGVGMGLVAQRRAARAKKHSPVSVSTASAPTTIPNTIPNTTSIDWPLARDQNGGWIGGTDLSTEGQIGGGTIDTTKLFTGSDVNAMSSSLKTVNAMSSFSPPSKINYTSLDLTEIDVSNYKQLATSMDHGEITPKLIGDFKSMYDEDTTKWPNDTIKHYIIFASIWHIARGKKGTSMFGKRDETVETVDILDKLALNIEAAVKQMIENIHHSATADVILYTNARNNIIDVIETKTSDVKTSAFEKVTKMMPRMPTVKLPTVKLPTMRRRPNDYSTRKSTDADMQSEPFTDIRTVPTGGGYKTLDISDIFDRMFVLYMMKSSDIIAAVGMIGEYLTHPATDSDDNNARMIELFSDFYNKHKTELTTTFKSFTEKLALQTRQSSESSSDNILPNLMLRLVGNSDGAEKYVIEDEYKTLIADIQVVKELDAKNALVAATTDTDNDTTELTKAIDEANNLGLNDTEEYKNAVKKLEEIKEKADTVAKEQALRDDEKKVEKVAVKEDVEEEKVNVEEKVEEEKVEAKEEKKHKRFLSNFMSGTNSKSFEYKTDDNKVLKIRVDGESLIFNIENGDKEGNVSLSLDSVFNSKIVKDVPVQGRSFDTWAEQILTETDGQPEDSDLDDETDEIQQQAMNHLSNNKSGPGLLKDVVDTQPIDGLSTRYVRPSTTTNDQSLNFG